MWKSQPTRFRDSHPGVPGEKNHLDVGSVTSHRVYYKGEGGGFPQVWAVVSLLCPCYSWLVLAPKVLQLCTNHFVWVMCKPMWVSEACQLFLVPSRWSNTPLYPSKCCELESMPWLLFLPLCFTWTHIWVLQGIGSASKCLIASWFEIGKGKLLLSISSKYSYFTPIFNYTRKGLWKGNLICWNCDSLMCFCLIVKHHQVFVMHKLPTTTFTIFTSSSSLDLLGKKTKQDTQKNQNLKRS